MPRVRRYVRKTPSGPRGRTRLRAHAPPPRAAARRASRGRAPRSWCRRGRCAPRDSRGPAALPRAQSRGRALDRGTSRNQRDRRRPMSLARGDRRLPPPRSRSCAPAVARRRPTCRRWPRPALRRAPRRGAPSLAGCADRCAAPRRPPRAAARPCRPMTAFRWDRLLYTRLACRRAPRPARGLLVPRARRARCLRERGQYDLVGIGEARLLAAHRAHADAALDAVAAAFDDAVFQSPRFVAAGLKIEVGAVDRMTHELVQHALDVVLRQTGGGENDVGGEVDGCAHAVSCVLTT